MTTLLLVRHGETEFNSSARFWGKTDVKLSALGLKQAERLRDRLAAEKIDTVYASTLSRATDTARLIAAPHNREITPTPELNEIDFGQFEGLTFSEINQDHPEMAESMAQWAVKPRFPGGESVDELNIRVTAFIARLKESPAETAVIVAHSGTLRLLICNLLGLDLRHWRQLRINLASLSIVETYPRGGILSLLNDISHLSLIQQ